MEECKAIRWHFISSAQVGSLHLNISWFDSLWMWPKGLSGSPKCNDSMHNRLHTVVKQLHVLKYTITTNLHRHINYSSSSGFVRLGTNIYSSNKKFVVKRLTWLFILPWNSSFIFDTDIIKYMQFIYKKKLTPWWIQRSSVVLLIWIVLDWSQWDVSCTWSWGHAHFNPISGREWLHPVIEFRIMDRLDRNAWTGSLHHKEPEKKEYYESWFS